MKAFKIALIAILAGLAVFLTVVMVGIMNGSGSVGFFGTSYNIGSGALRLQKEQEVPETEITAMEVDCDGTPFDISVLPGEGRQIKIEEYYNAELEPDRMMEVSVTNKKLVIRQRLAYGIVGWKGNLGGCVKVYIPAEIYESLKNMEIETTSGDIEISGWEECRPSMKEVRLSTTSGEITADYLNAEKVNVSSVSGDIEVQNVTGKLHASATSGTLDIRQLTGEGELNTVSGEVYVGTDRLAGDLKIGTTSGEVQLTIPQDSSFKLDIDTTSGSIDTFFDNQLSFSKRENSASGTVGNSPEYQIDINTTSGDVEIQN